MSAKVAKVLDDLKTVFTKQTNELYLRTNSLIKLLEFKTYVDHIIDKYGFSMDLDEVDRVKYEQLTNDITKTLERDKNWNKNNGTDGAANEEADQSSDKELLNGLNEESDDDEEEEGNENEEENNENDNNDGETKFIINGDVDINVMNGNSEDESPKKKRRKIKAVESDYNKYREKFLEDLERKQEALKMYQNSTHPSSEDEEEEEEDKGSNYSDDISINSLIDKAEEDNSSDRLKSSEADSNKTLDLNAKMKVNGDHSRPRSFLQRNFISNGRRIPGPRGRPRAKNFVCKICEESFPNNQTLKNHSIIHKTKNVFQCKHDGCDKVFKYKKSFEKHQSQHFQSGKEYWCDWDGCEFTTTDQDEFKAHKSDHKRPQSKTPKIGVLKYACNYRSCGKKFPKLKLLKGHMEWHRQQQKQLQLQQNHHNDNLQAVVYDNHQKQRTISHQTHQQTPHKPSAHHLPQQMSKEVTAKQDKQDKQPGQRHSWLVCHRCSFVTMDTKSLQEHLITCQGHKLFVSNVLASMKGQKKPSAADEHSMDIQSGL